jgi:hypothetical protein
MVESDPPGGDFGPSPDTVALRPDCCLTEAQIVEARRLRKTSGMSTYDIAAQLDVPMEDVDVALAAMRMPVTNPRRRTVNVGTSAYNAIAREKHPHESMWQTMDRLLSELHELRKKP